MIITILKSNNIEEILNSLLNQTFKNSEIIYVNDYFMIKFEKIKDRIHFISQNNTLAGTEEMFE